MSGTNYEQGDILLVPFPFSDLSDIKQRPVLVLSKDNRGADIITCGITSNTKLAPNSLLIDNNNLSTGDLPVLSRVRVDKLFTIEKLIVRKRIAKLNTRTMADVKRLFVGLV